MRYVCEVELIVASKPPAPEDANTETGADTGSPRILPDRTNAKSSETLTVTLLVACTLVTDLPKSGRGACAFTLATQPNTTRVRVKSIRFMATSSCIPTGQPAAFGELAAPLLTAVTDSSLTTLVINKAYSEQELAHHSETIFFHLQKAAANPRRSPYRSNVWENHKRYGQLRMQARAASHERGG